MDQHLTTPTSSEYKCQKCRDQEGAFYRDDQGYEYWRECECVKNRRAERLMQSSHITEEFQKKSFGNFDKANLHVQVQEAFDKSYRYTMEFNNIRKNRQNSMALLGQPGCGKTHLLMATSNNLIKRGVEVVYFPWVEGFNEISEDYKLLNERVKRLQHAEVLYIDDLYKGRDQPTKTQREQLFAIINYRYLEHKPILISSERNIAQMCEFDEGVGSRINEMCRDYKVILDAGIGINYRLKE